MSELENKSLNNRKLALFKGHKRVLEKNMSLLLLTL